MAVNAQARPQPAAFFPTPRNHVVQEEEEEDDEPEDDDEQNEQNNEMEDQLPAYDGPPPGNGPFDSKTELIECEFEDWRCKGCGMVNPPKKLGCGACGVFRSGHDWDDFLAFDAALAQLSLAERDHRPHLLSASSSSLLSPSSGATWSCSVCTLDNELLAEVCQACGSGKKPPGRKTEVTTKQCAGCTLAHPLEAVTCTACLRPFPREGLPRAAQRQQQHQEEAWSQPWDCPQCGARNEAAESRCAACGLHDVGREELLNAVLVRRLDREQREQQLKVVEALVEEETRRLEEQYGRENKLAHVEMSKNVEVMLEMQEKKAQADFELLEREMAGGLFEDPDFLPGRRSLYGSAVGDPKERIQWIRTSRLRLGGGAPLSVIGPEGIKATDIEQGALGDCWFLSALAVLAERSELLVSRLLLTKEISAIGAYQVRLCYNGTWTTVLIDDYFPVADEQTLLFSRAQKNQLWVSLIEKAYAKLHGSYHAMGGGYAYQGMADLTGAPCERIDFQDAGSLSSLGNGGGSGEPKIDTEMLWAKLLSARQSRFLIAASCGRKPPKRLGLLKDHSYSILDVVSFEQHRLIKLSNPWRKSGWAGDWSEQSALWTPELRAALVPVATEGVFWMSYSDVLKYLSAIEICKVRDNWDDSRIQPFFGGSPVAFRPSSSMFVISVTHPTWMVFQAIQEDERGQMREEDGDYHYSDLSLFVTETSASPLHFIDEADDGAPHHGDELLLDTQWHRLNAVTFPTVSRTVHCEAFLTNTNHSYLVMPVTFNARGAKKFVFSCYSAHTVLVRELTFDEGTLAVAAQQAIKIQDKFKVLEEYCFFYSGAHNDSIWFMVVNSHPTKTFRISLALAKSTNLLASRGSLDTVDTILPGHQQILNVLSIRQGCTGYSYSLKYSYQYLPDTFRGEVHQPASTSFHASLPIPV